MKSVHRGGHHVAITHDALDLTAQPPPRPPGNEPMGPICCWLYVGHCYLGFES